MTNCPIFIGGLQRSGTSLLRAIVGSHPQVALFQWDLPLWTQYFDQYKHQDLGQTDNITKMIDDIFSDEKARDCHFDLEKDNVLRRISESNNTVTCGIIFQCILEEYAALAGRPRWGLKTPHNEFYADDIFAAYPNARMVQLIRDPRDVAVSYQSYAGGAWKYSASEHISLWQRSIELSRRHNERYKEHYISVRYEDLVSDPETTVREVCATLALEFNSTMLETAGQPGWTGSNSFFGDIGKESPVISTTGIGRYQTNLQPYYTFVYQKQLSTYLTRYRYSLKRYDLSVIKRVGFSIRWLADILYALALKLGRPLKRKVRLILHRTQ
ncbi:sulfotransferase [Gemmatimonadota bacterium]